ncbi:hypothetical protein HMPREF1624_07065 [Sporothrix schenckii ATCC 58251]|uniref:Uncharacterized protein n=1 Tax=Sporothrix schenckii (strain ATCC 58251 / de Perez 2211183) TaxID=1391915 RepID=U7PPI2_SPOS1|nr:hypothetical protein HMPREF1624_07065 [Sporothrix schenckii ATCC 58251]
MDSSPGSGVSTLLKPRVLAVVVITTTAVLSLGAGIWYESWRQRRADNAELAAGGGLHRRNAVRRPRRGSHTDEPSGSATEPQTTTSIDESAAAPTTDENSINNVRPLQSEDREATVVDDGEMDERWLDDIGPPNSVQRAGHNIVNLLFRVSEDNARRSSYVHRGCACNACGIVPIRGIRYRCANCADFDLCETCESQGLHIKTHIFYKVKVPAPPFGPRQMQPVWYTGDPDGFVRGLPKSLLSRLVRETGFERQELEAFWEQWTYMANTEWRDDPDGLCLAMDRKTFERCLVPSGGYRHAAPNLIHDRMFAFYDTNNDGLIGFSEFLHGLSYRKRKDKLRKIFEGYDTDRDGLVNRRDFLRFFRAYYVLYKQMHKDILEGLDDQVMSSIETHQLVGNRQPLSSFFGRDGRLPHADTRRMMGGKYIDHAMGEVRVADGADGVVAEDRPDMADREELLSLLYTRTEIRLNGEGIFEERYFASNDNSGDEHDDGPAVVNYWDALLNPPRTVNELPSLLMGQRDPSDRNDVFVSNQDNEYEQGDDSVAMGTAEIREALAGGGRTHVSAETNSDDNASTTAVIDQPLPPSRASTSERHAGNATAHATTNANGSAANRDPAQRISRNQPGMPGEGVSQLDSSTPEQQDAITNNPRTRFNPWRTPTAGQLSAGEEAFMRAHLTKAAKVTARRKLHNRWMRRQFYLDEEEGAVAPSAWKDDEDLLAEGEASSSKSKAKATPADSDKAEHSRSRLADIPEAERDAGREVLYQVMQQAFNELLDILFLRKENLAIEAAESKQDRDKYRHLFEHLSVEPGIGVSNKIPSPPRKKAARSVSAADKAVSDMTLEEMLAETGYEVIGGVPTEDLDPPRSVVNGSANANSNTDMTTAATTATVPEANDAEIGAVEEVLEEIVEDVDDDIGEPKEDAVTEAAPEPAFEEQVEVVDTAGKDTPGRPAGDILATLDDVPEISLTAVAEVDKDHRDPTLPHFRPNTEAEYETLVAQHESARAPSQAASLVAASTAATVATSSEGRSSPGTTTPPVDEPSAYAGRDTGTEPEGIEKDEKDKGKGKAEATPTLESGRPGKDNKDQHNGSHSSVAINTKSADGSDKANSNTAPAPEEADIPLATLKQWKRLDLAEQEAQVRGGWGKLSYEEFELIFKQEEQTPNRLDYLGSWIDFCIP